MSNEPNITTVHFHHVGFEQIRRRWGWFVVLGLIIFLFGLIAIGSSTLFTLASMIFIGWLMMFGGGLQTLYAFTCKEWSGFLVDLLAGILYFVTGILIVAHPAATAEVLTLLIAVMLIFGGVMRISVAITVPFVNRFWLAIHGAINVLLGILICQAWPASGLWVIGLFIGIDMAFNGWTIMMLGLAARSLHRGQAV